MCKYLVKHSGWKNFIDLAVVENEEAFSFQAKRQQGRGLVAITEGTEGPLPRGRGRRVTEGVGGPDCVSAKGHWPSKLYFGSLYMKKFFRIVGSTKSTSLSEFMAFVMNFLTIWLEIMTSYNCDAWLSASSVPMTFMLFMLFSWVVSFSNPSSYFLIYWSLWKPNCWVISSSNPIYLFLRSIIKNDF